MATHWTDRSPTESLFNWMSRVYDQLDWSVFDAKVAEYERDGQALPPTIEALYLMRELEKVPLA